MRPYLRGIRLTYRNLSGPDRRPVELSVPASYPEYTLRGLRPNSTYSICAGPLWEPGGGGAGGRSSCTEARTAAGQQPPATGPPRPRGDVAPPPEPQVKDGQLITTLVPVLAAALAVAVVAGAVATVCYLRRRQAKGQPDLCADEPSPLELEGVKACLDNGGLPQKQAEITPPSQNGHDYEVPLMQTHCPANNNVASLKPSYF
ncbi:hypothetical protein AAFF_G00336480 [Aldrovandia affinis]|uniref:Fibronectin type-III domain-containing protein n=1 Tax=Aldrovandia affinis TaxID=143900 RepID=A0AAD7R6I5_9TELE|nr:hypothetical protein AAFF_G00336480 [Aldrovandia affinis]